MKEFRVGSIEKKNVEKAETSVTEYLMTGKDADGVSKIRLISPEPFDGLKPKEIIKVTIENSQTSLAAFKLSKEEEAEESEE